MTWNINWKTFIDLFVGTFGGLIIHNSDTYDLICPTSKPPTPKTTVPLFPWGSLISLHLPLKLLP